MSSSEDEVVLTPNTLMERHAKNVVEQMLPSKSKQNLKTYENFMRWRAEKQVNGFSESIFLTYFDELSKKFKPTTLWSVYSMLKTTLQMKNDVHIQTYVKLSSYLKRLSTGHKSVKSKVFTASQIETFINTAPDEKYLAIKVALIFGISGACRGKELINITLDDMKTDTQLQAINFPDTKTNKERTFVVKGEYLNIVKKYQALRPENVATKRFFINYQNGKCTRQPIGRNKFAAMPKQIAVFLGLENPETYTGHCFRRTSATLLADSGANMITLKRHGGWKSDQVAEGYIEESIKQKAKITDLITEGINIDPHEPEPSSANLMEQDLSDNNPSVTTKSPEFNNMATITSQIQSNATLNMPGKTITLNISHCSNVTFNFN